MTNSAFAELTLQSQRRIPILLACFCIFYMVFVVWFSLWIRLRVDPIWKKAEALFYEPGTWNEERLERIAKANRKAERRLWIAKVSFYVGLALSVFYVGLVCFALSWLLYTPRIG